MVTESTSLVASRIDAARKAAGMSELKLAEQTAIPYTTLRRKLRGRKAFDIDEVVLVADALKVDFVDWLRDLSSAA